MIGARAVVVCGLLVGLVGDAAASDVKETVRLLVSAENVPDAIPVEEPALLAESQVFSGRFIGAAAAEPDTRWRRYRVVFDIQTRDGVKRQAYVVYYATDPGTGKGFVYLPGPQDADYRDNISTILRTDFDGTWRHASPAWALALNRHLPRD